MVRQLTLTNIETDTCVCPVHPTGVLLKAWGRIGQWRVAEELQKQSQCLLTEDRRLYNVPLTTRVTAIKALIQWNKEIPIPTLELWNTKGLTKPGAGPFSWRLKILSYRKSAVFCVKSLWMWVCEVYLSVKTSPNQFKTLVGSLQLAQKRLYSPQAWGQSHCHSSLLVCPTMKPLLLLLQQMAPALAATTYYLPHMLMGKKMPPSTDGQPRHHSVHTLTYIYCSI